MNKRSKVSNSIRENVVKLHKQNYSIRSIAEKLKLSKSVVGRISKLNNGQCRIISPYKVGRPRKTTKREDRIMQRMTLKDRFETSAGIARIMEATTSVNVSRKTVSRRLKEIGLFARRPQKKPLISLKNQKKEICLCQQACHLV